MISIVVLAAGLSTRFGSNKLLTPIKGKPMIQIVVGECAKSDADDIIVVLGHQAEQIRSLLASMRCRIVLNDEFLQGQSSSVKKGVKEALGSDAVLILPGDSVFVRATDINKVIQRYLALHNAIVVASHDGRMGHPILFDRALFDEVLGIDEATEGLKAVLERNAGRIEKVECGNVGVTLDVDTEEDLRAHAHLFAA